MDDANQSVGDKKDAKPPLNELLPLSVEVGHEDRTEHILSISEKLREFSSLSFVGELPPLFPRASMLDATNGFHKHPHGWETRLAQMLPRSVQPERRLRRGLAFYVPCRSLFNQKQNIGGGVEDVVLSRTC